MSKKKPLPRRLLPHERVLTPNQVATLDHLKNAADQAERLRAAQAKELARARVDRFVLAIASGWYGVSDSREVKGTNDYGENPRAVPALTNGAIVDAALDLMKQADEAAEELAQATLAPPPPAPPPAGPPPTPQDPSSDASTGLEGLPRVTVAGPYGRLVSADSDAPQQGAS